MNTQKVMASGQPTAPVPARMPATRNAATAVAVMPGAVLLYAERTCAARMRSSCSMLFVAMPPAFTVTRLSDVSAAAPLLATLRRYDRDHREIHASGMGRFVAQAGSLRADGNLHRHRVRP